MAGFGGELLLFISLGYLVLGPKRMHTLLQQLARLKAGFEKTRHEIASELSREMTVDSESLMISKTTNENR
jgi:Sec-independent protein translocase protein TatA